MTSIEWLFLMLNNPNRNQEFANKLLNKAKEIHKREIEDAFSSGHTSGENKALNIPEKSRRQYDPPEQYYNETFKTA